jgi:hypothetical protein
LCFKIGLIALVVLSYFLGNRATIDILVKHRNKYLVIYLYGLINLLTASVIYNITRLVLYDNEFDLDSMLMLFGRPIFIGLVFGLPSIILFGTIFARQITKLKA